MQSPPSANLGQVFRWVIVGGAAVSQWLEERFWGFIDRYWHNGNEPELHITGALRMLVLKHLCMELF